MCAALTAERVQSEGSVGADRNAHDVACESHAPSTAVQRGSRSGHFCERPAGRSLQQAGGAEPPSGRRAASFLHLQRYAGTQLFFCLPCGGYRCGMTHQREKTEAAYVPTWGGAAGFWSGSGSVCAR